eukprot:scaffold23682_cov61-Phaeocystis_antarctica.AAC.5
MALLTWLYSPWLYLLWLCLQPVLGDHLVDGRGDLTRRHLVEVRVRGLGLGLGGGGGGLEG